MMDDQAPTMDGHMTEKAREATVFLKAIANENRLLILCHLAMGEKSVTELEHLLWIRQPTLSQQLARFCLAPSRGEKNGEELENNRRFGQASRGNEQ